MSSQMVGDDTETRLFARAVDAMEGWIDTRSTDVSGSVETDISGYIAQRLPADNTIRMGSGPRDCDIVIDDTIGIKVITQFYQGSREWVHKEFRAILSQYDYVILYGHMVPEKRMDFWRSLSHSIEQGSSLSNAVHVMETYRVKRTRIPFSRSLYSMDFLIRVAVVIGFGATVFGLYTMANSEPAFEENAQMFLGAIVVINLVAIAILYFLYRMM